MKQTVAIVGAGMSGTVMAYILAGEGYDVTIYEKRSDCRCDTTQKGRSVNLTLAERGIQSLEKIGISRNEFFSMCVGLKGRQIHKANGKLKFQAYGTKKGELIYSILRKDLNCFLLNYIEKNPEIKILFNQECIEINKKTREVHFLDKINQKKFIIKPDILIGADGTFSTVRQQMQKGIRVDYSQSFLNSGYKELRIQPDKTGGYRLDPTYLHVYPRGETLLLALSNNDGSFTCTCVVPHEGRIDFNKLNHPENCEKFFKKYYPELFELIPDVLDNFSKSPINEFITTKTSVWFYQDWIVLIGDAAHTVTPFYGQGMNTALEGCWVLADCLKKNENNLQAAFSQYQSLRKKHTDTLAGLSISNFIELKDKVRYPSIDLMKNINFTLEKLFPTKWLPLYTMIAHTTIPFADAVAIEKKQNRFLKLFGIGILTSALNFAAKTLYRISESFNSDDDLNTDNFIKNQTPKNQDYLGHRAE
jgi:kynurenine 3-monooxygenase